MRVFVLCDTNIFLSTPSARRATDLNDERAKLTKISIHALREEGDAPAYCEQTSFCYFYPRPPRGGRLAVKCINHFVICISIHALREEGDPLIRFYNPDDRISIHALREEGDTLLV